MNHHHETFLGSEYCCRTSDPQKYHQMNHFQIDLIVTDTDEYPVSKFTLLAKISSTVLPREVQKLFIISNRLL